MIFHVALIFRYDTLVLYDLIWFYLSWGHPSITQNCPNQNQTIYVNHSSDVSLRIMNA